MNEIHTLRNTHFLQAIARVKNKAKANGDILTVQQLCSLAAKEPAPGYYISYGYARRHLSRIVDHRSNSLKIDPSDPSFSSPRTQMMIEVARKCIDYRRSVPGLELGYALARVLAFERASSFFLSDSYAVTVYYHGKNALTGTSRKTTGRRRNRKLFRKTSSKKLSCQP